MRYSSRLYVRTWFVSRKKLEADLKSLSKIDDLLGVKQSGECGLSDDQDAPTSKKVYKKTVPAV